MQKGSVLPVILIFVCVVVITAAGFIYFRIANLKSVLQTIPKSAPSLAPSFQTQTISDDLLGLKLDIPSKHTLKRETEEEYFKRANGNVRKNFNYYVLYNPAEFKEAFYILKDPEINLDKALITCWVFGNPDNLDPKEFYEKYWYYPFVWGDFTERKYQIAPESIELIGGKVGEFGTVDYREGKPKFIYLPLRDKNLMLQIQLKSEENLVAQDILRSFMFE